MEIIVSWWCNLIGIADPTAIQIATGVVGGGLALAIVLIAWQLAVMLLSFMVDR
jgi:hypothetical protein